MLTAHAQCLRKREAVARERFRDVTLHSATCSVLVNSRNSDSNYYLLFTLTL